MKNKYIPTRMCAVCRKRFPKNELVRVVKNKNGEFAVDWQHSLNGRGAYVCHNEECNAKLFKTRALNRVFKGEVPERIYKEIKGEN